MSPQDLLDAIAALSEAERRELLARLRERYPEDDAPTLQQGRLPLSDWTGPVDYLIVFDGGSHGNPGPGYGSYVIFDARGDGQPVRLEFPGEVTNNEAEYQTLLAALRDLRQRLGHSTGQLAIKILGDSRLVVQQVNGAWQTKEPRLRSLRNEVLAELRHFKAYRLAYQPREDTLKVLGH
ncbi:MAG: ribonuclease HI family protein [Anaerolineales bacterium]|nr:ribonuclease HI family protein [Anaerolineales bacterium]